MPNITNRLRWQFPVLAIAVASLLVAPHILNPYYADLVFRWMVFTVLALSWNLLAGYCGQISLGHAAFFGIGAFISAWLTRPSAIGLPESIALPVFLSIVVGGVFAALFALVTGPALFRLRGHYFAIGTLALSEVVRLVLANNHQYSGGATGFFLTAGDPVVRYYYGLLFLVITAVTIILVVRSRHGLAMQSVRDDEDAAAGLGVRPFQYKMYAFVLSSFFAGIAGGMLAQQTLFISPDSTVGVAWTIDTLVIVVLGGRGTIMGPILGSILFVLMDFSLTQYVGELAMTVEGILLIGLIIFLPAGLYGYYRKRSDTSSS